MRLSNTVSSDFSVSRQFAKTDIPSGVSYSSLLLTNGLKYANIGVLSGYFTIGSNSG